MSWSEWFYYDETSPSCLRWKVDQGQRAREHFQAGWKDGDYFRVMLFRKSYLVSRVIWEMLKGTIPEGFIVDHFDGDTTNNCIANLRCVLEEFNPRNAKKRSDNLTGITGICARTIKGIRYYVAQWMDNGKVIGKYLNRDRLGDDKALSLAVIARDAAIDKLNQSGKGYTERHGT